MSTKNDTGSSIYKDLIGIWGRRQAYVNKKKYLSKMGGNFHQSQFPYLVLLLLIERITVLNI